ncbi:MAG: MBL fold metallo-hydrolase [Saccharofermentans sp.]|nr:MBL fold metallo-hydrolase [Saccharofermentans sp.]
MLNNFEVPAKIGSATVYNVTPVRGGDAYLFVFDDVTFLYDSGYGFSSKKLYENIVAVLGERNLDYVLLTHSHYDHALGSAYLSVAFPECRIVGFEYAARVMLKDGARATMTRLDEAARELKGFTEPYEYIDKLHIDIPVTDGQTLKLGSLTCEVISLPGHTRDSVSYYFPGERLMLGCETVGLYAKEGVVMPSFLVGYQMTLDSIDKCSAYDIDNYLVPHQGMLSGDEVRDFIANSRVSHEHSSKLIIDGFKKGKSIEELVDDFSEDFYHEFIRVVYPPAAYSENVHIQIPMILKENGLLE